MVVKSRLRQAIIAEKGIDMKQKKQRRDNKLNAKQTTVVDGSDDDASDEELKVSGTMYIVEVDACLITISLY